MSFRQASAIERTGEFVFRVDISDGWQQGRGAYGGLVLGILLRAMQACEPEAERVPRSLSGELVGAVLAEPAEIEVTVLRRGNNLTSLDARLTQNGEVQARASAILAREREVDVLAVRPTAIEPPPWEDQFVAPIKPPLGPVFAEHYEYRPFGPLPFCGGDEAVAAGWVRETVPPESYDHPAIVGLLDSYWPTLFATMTMPRPMATIGFMAEFLMDPAELDPSIPLHYRARGIAEFAGYLTEFRELWSGDTPVALNQQVFAIIK